MPTTHITVRFFYAYYNLSFLFSYIDISDACDGTDKMDDLGNIFILALIQPLVMCCICGCLCRAIKDDASLLDNLGIDSG